MTSSDVDAEMGVDEDTEAKLQALSRALHIDRRLVDSELICFVMNKRVSREQCTINRSMILEAWRCVPQSFKISPRSPGVPERMQPTAILAGASPRSSKVPLASTFIHPQLTRAVTSYIKQCRPEFQFTTFAIREDLPREPHRDTRNGPCGTFFQTLNSIPGGGLWIAHKEGLVFRQHNGIIIKGCYLEASNEPVIFDARKHLHASGEWDYNKTRTVLIAWTVIHSRTLTVDLRSQLLEAGFPIPTPEDLAREVPRDWQPTREPVGKKPKLHQQTLQFHRPNSSNSEPGLKLDGSSIVHQLD